MPRPALLFVEGGHATDLQAYLAGTLSSLPELPTEIDAGSTAAYIRRVMNNELPVPAPIAQQVAHILQLVAKL